jgi:uncharacterized protein (TIGR03086 family)
MAAAWKDPAAWEGMTQLGGMDLPAEVIGQIALGELLMHGWDLAVSTGQSFDYDGPHLDEMLAMVNQFQDMGIPGVFAARVAVPESASPFEQLIGTSGRDPRWKA